MGSSVKGTAWQMTAEKGNTTVACWDGDRDWRLPAEKLGGSGLIQSKYRGEREGAYLQLSLSPEGRSTCMACLDDCSSSFISSMELQNWDTTI